MKKDWHFQTTLPTAEEPELEFEEVLVFYEEPQIGIVEYGGSRHLAVAADEDREAGTIRWLLAEVTSSDVLAVKTGALTLREAIETHETITVVDTNTDLQIQETYEATVSELTETCLPDRSAFLPSRVREAYREELREEPSTVRVEGEPINDHTLPFRLASDLFGELQRLWNALAQVANEETEITRQGAVPMDLRDRARLALASISEGSANLEVEADDATLNRQIAELFEDLVTSRLDENELHRRLDEFGPRVESAYSALVKAVRKHEISVFTANHGSTGYITPTTARKIESLLENYEPTTQMRKAHGYFVAFDMESHFFRFRELENGQEFEGDVALDVAEEIDEIAVGEPRKYEIQIEITRKLSPTDQEKGQEIVLKSLDEDI